MHGEPETNLCLKDSSADKHLLFKIWLCPQIIFYDDNDGDSNMQNPTQTPVSPLPRNQSLSTSPYLAQKIQLEEEAEKTPRKLEDSP